MSSRTEHWRERTVQMLAGESQVTHRAVFTSDSKYVLAPCGNHVIVYGRETGRIVNELHFHTDLVTHLVLGHDKSMKVYSCSLDGHIAVWDYTDGGLLKTYDFGQPLVYFALRTIGKESFLYLVIKNIQDSSYSIISLPGHLLLERKTSTSLNQFVSEATPILSVKTPLKEILFTFDDTHLVTFSNKTLYIISIETDYDTLQLSSLYSITSCACHPTKHCIATGDSLGQIHLWYNYCKEAESVVMTKLHWHAHAVGDVCFSTDGTYLLSGGEEGVLVMWQLATDMTHFRPRLGAPVVGVACCQGDRTFAVSLANNSIQLVSGLENEVTRSLVSLYRALPGMGYEERLCTGLVYDPRSKCLVMNGIPGHLQFFNVDTGSVNSQVEVIPVNFVSRTDDKLLTPITIDWAAFSPVGEWLATVERWDSKEFTQECKLKFWKYQTKDQKYILNTSVEPPHQDHVTCLTFRPDSRNRSESALNWNEPKMNENESCDENEYSLAVTTGLDGKFKVWVPELNDSKKKFTWCCLSAGYYHNLPCHGCDFSDDGSVLAVNFGKYITLWEPLSLNLMQVLGSSVPNDCFTHVCFGHVEASHYLLVSSYHHFHLWNLLSYDLELVLPLTVDAMATDPYSDSAAIFTSVTNSSTTNVNLMIISPLSSKPLAVYKNISSAPVEFAVFLPVTQNSKTVSSQLYFMDKKQLLYTVCVDSGLHDDSLSSVEGRVSLVEKERSRRRFHEIFGKQSHRSVAIETKPDLPVDRKEDKVLSAPPLSLPPMNVYCKSYLMSLLPGTKAPPTTQLSTEVLDSDRNNAEGAESSDEEDSKPHPPQLLQEVTEMEVEDTGSRKLDVPVSKFDWLIGFFRTELL